MGAPIFSSVKVLEIGRVYIYENIGVSAAILQLTSIAVESLSM